MRHWLGFLVIVSFFAFGAAGVMNAPIAQTAFAGWFVLFLFAFVCRGVFRLLSGSPNGIVRKNLAPRA